MPRIPGFPEKPHYNSVKDYLSELAKDIAEIVVDPVKMERFREQLKKYAEFWQKWKTFEDAEQKGCWKPEMGRPECIFNIFSRSYNLLNNSEKEKKILAGSYALCALIHDSQLPHLDKINTAIIPAEAVEETLSSPKNMLEARGIWNSGPDVSEIYLIEDFFNYVKVDLQEFCNLAENKSKQKLVEEQIQQASKLSDIEFLKLTAEKFEERAKKILNKNETWYDLDRSLKGWFDAAIERLKKLKFTESEIGLLSYIYKNLLHYARGINIKSFRDFPDSRIVELASNTAFELAEKFKEIDPVNVKIKPKKGSYKAQQELAVEEADKLVADAAQGANKDIFLLYCYSIKALNYAVDMAKMTRSKEPWAVDQFIASQVRLLEYVKRIDTYPNIITLLESWPSNPGITFAWLSGQNALDVAIHFARMINNGVAAARNEHAFHGGTSYDNLIVCPNPNIVFVEWETRTVAELLAREIPKPDVWPSMADIHRESQSLLYKLQDEYKRAVNNKNQNSIKPQTQQGIHQINHYLGKNYIKATIKHLPYVGAYLFDLIYGVDGVKVHEKEETLCKTDAVRKSAGKDISNCGKKTKRKNKKIPLKQEETIVPKTPEFVQNLLWIIKYGGKYWKLLVVAGIILLTIFFVNFFREEICTYIFGNTLEVKPNNKDSAPKQVTNLTVDSNVLVDDRSKKEESNDIIEIQNTTKPPLVSAPILEQRFIKTKEIIQLFSRQVLLELSYTNGFIECVNITLTIPDQLPLMWRSYGVGSKARHTFKYKNQTYFIDVFKVEDDGAEIAIVKQE